LVEALRELGPVAVKLGQILAMRSDLLAPEWTTALAGLQDRVPGVPFAEIAEPIAEALGDDYRAYFRSIQPEPIAAGSIAQVHAGVRTDGKQVIVKVRRPGIEPIVDADMRILRRIARIAQRASPLVARQNPDELLRFFAESLDREMDLGAEARASAEIGAYLARFGIETARFDDEVSGRSLNVQHRVDALAATDAGALERAGIDRTAVARLYARAVLSMIIFNGRFHADPHPGNVLIRPDGTLVFIDFGAVGTLLPERRDELVRLSLAIAGDDVEELVAVLLHWAGNPAVDREALAVALRDLIRKFRNTLLEQIDLSEIFADVFALLRAFELSLPGDLALMLRTLLTAEGFVRRLDPQFDITTELAPIARQLVMERASFAKLRGDAQRTMSILARTALNAPKWIEAAERIARGGRVPISLAREDLAVIADRLGDQAHRGGRDVILAAFIVSAALLADSVPTLAFACAAAAAGWLALTWLRRR
jgi:ubiquinone biosynthesis protein